MVRLADASAEDAVSTARHAEHGRSGSIRANCVWRTRVDIIAVRSRTITPGGRAGQRDSERSRRTASALRTPGHIGRAEVSASGRIRRLAGCQPSREPTCSLAPGQPPGTSVSLVTPEDVGRRPVPFRRAAAW